jgi:hypothetical protein
MQKEKGVRVKVINWNFFFGEIDDYKINLGIYASQMTVYKKGVLVLKKNISLCLKKTDMELFKIAFCS